jgi:transposase
VDPTRLEGASASRAAKIVLLANTGRTNQQIAEALRTRTARVSKWRQRFGVKRLAGLADAARSGKPAKHRQATEKPVLALLDERLLCATRNGMADCWRKPFQR